MLFAALVSIKLPRAKVWEGWKVNSHSGNENDIIVTWPEVTTNVQAEFHWYVHPYVQLGVEHTLQDHCIVIR